MLINLSDVGSTLGKVVEMTAVPELVEVKNRTKLFPIAEKRQIRWIFSNTGKNRVRVEAEGAIVLTIPCDRCLADVRAEIPVDFSQEFDLSESREDRLEALDEADFIEGYELDADKLLYHELLLNWPARILCKPDCKGICMKCGRNRNEGTCGCSQQEYDPRMAVIKDIFNGIS